jgi:hypothetical protein
MSRRDVDAYVRHVERYGPEGVLEAAAHELSQAEYRQLRLRLGAGDTIAYATPGCSVVFVPERKGQRYHSDACRQKAHRSRSGPEATHHGRGRPARAISASVPDSADSRYAKPPQQEDRTMSIEPRDDRGYEMEARLETLAEEIREELLLADSCWKHALQHAVLVGEKLIEAKSLVIHGQWLPWLRENFADSERTAQLYMRLARNPQEIADLPTVREAIAVLTRPKDEQQVEAVSSERDPDAEPVWPVEWALMSDEVWKAHRASARAVLRALSRQAKANGELGVAVPRWALDVVFYDFWPAAQLARRAKDGDIEAEHELAEAFRRAGRRVAA